MGKSFNLYHFFLSDTRKNLMIETNKNHTQMQINSIFK